MRKFLNDFLNREDGQALVEYILALSIVITIVTILATGLRTSMYKVWEFYSRQVSAACPGCPPAPSMRFR